MKAKVFLQPYIDTLKTMKNHTLDLGHNLTLQIFPNTIAIDQNIQEGIGDSRYIFVLRCQLAHKQRVINDFPFNIEISDSVTDTSKDYIIKKLLTVLSSKSFVPSAHLIGSFIQGNEDQDLLRDIYTDLKSCVVAKNHNPIALNGHFMKSLTKAIDTYTLFRTTIPNHLRDFLYASAEDLGYWVCVESDQFLVKFGPGQPPYFQRINEQTWIRTRPMGEGIAKRLEFARQWSRMV